MKIHALTLAALLAVPTFAAAQTQQRGTPPADAMPLSEVLAQIEAREDVAYFDEVEWDSDGYWEVEFYRPDGVYMEIDIDPVSGEVRQPN